MKIALRSMANGKLVCAEGMGAQPLIANRDHPGSWETFEVIVLESDAPIPNPPPQPVNTPGWQQCAPAPAPGFVACVQSAIGNTHTPEGAFDVTKRVAWLLSARLLLKPGGENIVSWHGQSFSASRIVYQGHMIKLLSDVPTTNGPSWQDEGLTDQPSVPALNPES